MRGHQAVRGGVAHRFGWVLAASVQFPRLYIWHFRVTVHFFDFFGTKLFSAFHFPKARGHLGSVGGFHLIGKNSVAVAAFIAEKSDVSNY